ncbi:MAG TPA: RNA polymerase sigma factor RpoD/SigA [Saprospiraceae bacterium]|jgi:RNA polymerase primary sigma factor|nr:RNA polymerase sigma factor RpoD/SigA [Saprospiraceae bacterium]
MRQLKIANRITSRESLALEKYLADISKIEMISPEEETRLAAKVRAGDQAALERLTEANLRFVVSVAKQYQNQGLSLSDLINEGNVGLMKAAKRFDETKGFKFISYAVWWIRQSILQSIVEYSRIVRMPHNKSTSYNRLNEAFVSFVQEFEREPTHEELADLLNVNIRDVINNMPGASRHVSFDAPVSSDEDSFTLLDMIETDENMQPDLKLMEESLRLDIQYSLNALAPREAEVLAYYFGLKGEKPLTLDEIGVTLELTRERVRQIKERAIRRLRKTMKKNSTMRTYI